LLATGKLAVEMLQVFVQYDLKSKHHLSTKKLSPMKAMKLQQVCLKGKVLLETFTLVQWCYGQ
jgi:hypothetical protein